MAVRARRRARASTDGRYTLMVPPPEERFTQAPAWVAGDGDLPAGGLPAIRLHAAMADTPGVRRRLGMLVEHLDALGTWTELARELLDDDSPHAAARAAMATALVDFAAQAVAATSGGGPLTVDARLRELVLEAVAEATLVAAGCFDRTHRSQRPRR